MLGSKILKDKLKRIKMTIYLKERVINDDDLDDDEEYLLKNDYDTKYKGIESIRYLFDEDENKNYYKPKLINSAFKNNYLQYQTGHDRKKCCHLVDILKRLNQV